MTEKSKFRMKRSLMMLTRTMTMGQYEGDRQQPRVHLGMLRENRKTGFKLPSAHLASTMKE